MICFREKEILQEDACVVYQLEESVIPIVDTVIEVEQ